MEERDTRKTSKRRLIPVDMFYEEREKTYVNGLKNALKSTTEGVIIKVSTQSNEERHCSLLAKLEKNGVEYLPVEKRTTPGIPFYG